MTAAVREKRAARESTARPVCRYLVTCSFGSVAVSAHVARAFFDAHPEDQRTGDRERAFILWQVDELGRRSAPVLFRPVLGKTA